MTLDTKAPAISVASPSAPGTIDQFFGVDSITGLADEIRMDLSTITSMMNDEGIEMSNLFGVLKGISSHVSKTDDKAIQIKKVLSKMAEFRSHGISLSNFFENMEDLHDFALRTGNWAPFLKQSSKNKEKLLK